MTGNWPAQDDGVGPMDIAMAAASCLVCHRPILAVTVRGWTNAFDAVPTEGDQGGSYSPHRCEGRPERGMPGFN
jgi:hypothetical protein